MPRTLEQFEDRHGITSRAELVAQYSDAAYGGGSDRSEADRIERLLREYDRLAYYWMGYRDAVRAMEGK